MYIDSAGARGGKIRRVAGSGEGADVRRRGFLIFGRFRGGGFARRQKDAETGAGTRAGAEAAEVDAAFVLLHDAFADPEAEAGALGRLRSEKGLEEVPGVFGADAAAGIDDGNDDAATLGFEIEGVG